MSQFIVRNPENPNNIVRFGLNFIKVADKYGDGGRIWVAEVATLAKDVNGDDIPPYYINTTSKEKFNEEVNEAVSYLSSIIDWGASLDDIFGPHIDYIEPDDYYVDINSSINFVLKDRLPSSGIDKSTIKVKINGVDVTDNLDIRGNPYNYKVKWSPPTRTEKKV